MAPGPDYGLVITSEATRRAAFIARLCAMSPFDKHPELANSIVTRLGPGTSGGGFGWTIVGLEGYGLAVVAQRPIARGGGT